MKGYSDTQHRVVQTNASTGSRKKEMAGHDGRAGQALSSPWTQQEKKTQETRSQRMKRQVQSARRADQQRRMARVEELRELVQTGRYYVDSMTLAQSMLENETHFIEMPPQ